MCHYPLSKQPWWALELIRALWYTISVIITAQWLLQNHKVIAMIKQCFTFKVISGWKHFHVAWSMLLLDHLQTTCQTRAFTEATEGPSMGWVVLQLCPSTELMLTILPGWWIQKVTLCWFFIEVDFDVINPKFLMLFCFVVFWEGICLGCFVKTSSFGWVFVPSYKVFSEDTGGMDLFFPFLSTLLKGCLGVCLVTFKHSAHLLEMCQRS